MEVVFLDKGILSTEYIVLIITGIVMGTAARVITLVLKEGVVIEPKKPINCITLENYGQRQAMIFEAARALGVKRYRFTRRSFTQGKVAIALVPIVNDIDAMISAVKNTPILENSRKIHRIMRPGKEKGE